MDNFQNWTPKWDVMEMGTVTGNGSAISCTGKLRVWVTYIFTHCFDTIFSNRNDHNMLTHFDDK
jgi:hypothetical protein